MSCLEDLTQGFTHRSGLTQTLSYNITSTSEGFLNRRYLIIHKGLCFTDRIYNRHRIHLICKRLKSSFLCSSCTCTTLWTIRKIKILQFTSFDTVLDTLTKVSCQSTCIGNGLKDSLLTLLHLSKHISPVTDLSDCHIIQPSSTFLTISADERNRSTLLKKRSTILHLPILHSQPLCNI